MATVSDMREIGELIRTQDNLATSHPMFIVQEKVRICGVDMNYTDTSDSYVWTNKQGGEADEETTELLDRLVSSGGQFEDLWTKTGYIDRWEFVTAFFTRAGCERYISRYGHNLNNPRIYVESAYRNEEFIAVREFLKSKSQGHLTLEDG